MRMNQVLMVVGAAFVLSACPKADDKPKTAEPAKIEPAKTAEPAAQAGNRKMANCPSSVAGATTKVEDAADAVVVTVTGAGEAVAEIRSRSKHLAEVSTKAPTEIKHTGEGEGGGGLGNCPVVLADTTITAEDVEGGSKLTVKPANAADLAKLAALARERQAKLAAPK